MIKGVKEAQGFVIAGTIPDKGSMRVFLDSEGMVVASQEDAHVFDNHQAAMGFLEYISETPTVLDFEINPVE